MTPTLPSLTWDTTPLFYRDPLDDTYLAILPHLTHQCKAGSVSMQAEHVGGKGVGGTLALGLGLGEKFVKGWS